MYQYSFANTDLNLSIPTAGGSDNNITVEGFQAGEDLITITRRVPVAGLTFGAYGDMVVSMQRIEAGDLSFVTLQNAPENEYLTDYLNYFQAQAWADGELVRPIQGSLVDTMGNDQVTLHNGVILNHPALSRGQTVRSVRWVLTFERVIINIGSGRDYISL